MCIIKFMRKFFRILLILALFAGALALGWLRRPDITPYLLHQTQEEDGGSIDNSLVNTPVFDTGALEHTQTPENLKNPEQRPNFWPEPLQQSAAAKAADDSGLPDCTLKDYEFDAKQPFKGNVGKLKDATVNCKVKILKKSP